MCKISAEGTSTAFVFHRANRRTWERRGVIVKKSIIIYKIFSKYNTGDLVFVGLSLGLWLLDSLADVDIYSIHNN
jgi:hypothetical protein